jgi:hypothetical protein
MRAPCKPNRHRKKWPLLRRAPRPPRVATKWRAYHRRAARCR